MKDWLIITFTKERIYKLYEFHDNCNLLQKIANKLKFSKNLQLKFVPIKKIKIIININKSHFT